MGYESESDVYPQCRQSRAKKITSVCIWGGSSPGLTSSLHRESERLYTTEREEIIATPGVLLLLFLLPFAKPNKLPPVEN